MAKKEEGKGNEDDEIVMVGPGADQEEEAEDTSGEEIEASGEGEEGEEEEERTGHDADDVPAETKLKRQRRKAERAQRRQRYHRDQTELNFLRERNESLERRFSEVESRTGQNEILAIDSRITEVKNRIVDAENVFAMATEKQDGKSAAEALRIKDQFRDQLFQLEQAKWQVSQGIETGRRESAGAANRPDPAIAARARQWIAENDDWFDPKLGDEASTIAHAIEQRLYNEKILNPRSDEYYKELNRRIAKRLPELGLEVEDGGNEEGDRGSGKGNGKRRNGAGGGPRFATGGGQQRRLGKNEVYVSPERIEAMKQAGVWDDPELRTRYLKRYQSYDRDHSSSRH